jgi:hypothetical protein
MSVPVWLLGYFDPYHNNARSTESTLTTARHGNPLLSRVRTLDIANALHRNDMFPIDTNDRCEARIDGCVVDLAGGRIQLRNNLDAPIVST